MSLSLLALAALLQAPAAPCDSVPACIAEARRVAKPGEGIDEAEQAVAGRLEALAPESIDAVIELLDDPDPELRALAGFTISGMPGLEPRHFDPLRRAALAGTAWVTGAFATIGTPEAMEFLMDALRRERQRDGPVTAALASFGRAAVPGLVELFRCRADCDEDLLLAAASALEEMDEGESRPAVTSLAEVAADVSMPVANRVRVLRVLGWLGPAARPVVSELITLSRSESVLIRKAARDALLQIGGEATEEVLAALLQEPGPKAMTLRDIASHGSASRPVGRHVEALLVTDDRNDRVAAARALGFIDYAAAGPALAAALDDDADWRLVYAAAESLGRLRSKEARAALESTSERHWYPPVREAARIAMRRIDGLEVVPPPSEDGFAHEFFDLDQVPSRHGSCDALPSAPVVPRRVRRLSDEDLEVARTLSYPITSRERRSPQMPGVGLRVPGGWLLGSDNGEWGGELVFRPDQGPVQLLREENIQGIELVGRSTLVAIGGLAHLASDDGAVYRIEHDAERGWRATWWRQLPGAPDTSWPIAGNQLLIVSSGGSIVLSPDGTMALAPCHAERRP